MSILTVVRSTPSRLAVRVGQTEPQAGMTTAEYAVGTVAACGFGGVLYKVITSPTVLELLKSVITKAFHLPF